MSVLQLDDGYTDHWVRPASSRPAPRALFPATYLVLLYHSGIDVRREGLPSDGWGVSGKGLGRLIAEGWQGDWRSEQTSKDKFPSGLKGAADAARQRGLVPGLWVAPWAADKRSKLARQHPEWMLRKPLVRPAALWRWVLAAPYRLLLW